MSRRIGHAVHAFDVVDSTQTMLARLAEADAPEGTVVTARHQLVGRGSRGRHWWDESGGSLLTSVLLRPPLPIAAAPQLSLVAGLAVSDALVRVAGVAARIRWPNDVLVDGRKICGVLPEAMSRVDGSLACVLLGVGINVDQIEFPGELRDRATSLRLATGRAHDQRHILSAVLLSLDRRYREWLVSGFAGLREEWRGRSITLGEPVKIADGRVGVAVDVDETGALLVDAGAPALTRVVSLSSAAAP